MSVASKRRYMMNKLEFEMYTPVDGDSIAQVLAPKGNNLHEVFDEHGETYLVSMPSKFRKSVWIRKGQFVVVRPIEEGDKVRAEIEHVLDDENILHIRSEGKWPARFEESARLMCRDVKRGVNASVDEGQDKNITKSIIDDDMLPPSESESDEEENEEDAEENDEEEEEGADEDEEEDQDVPQIYNPNRL